MQTKPLVSVGIPTYNRPLGLRRTLECITSQTYHNLEIIISDNASPDPEVEQVAKEFQKQDARIRHYRQEENKGPAHNFLFVLKQASGKYFMWAADDDEWVNYYIDELAGLLESPTMASYVAANFEAQYTDQNGMRFDFFPEGAPFYNFENAMPYERLRHILEFNYGNIIYSLYRRDSLTINGIIFVENEIPFLLQIIRQGNWKVLPKIGFYKKTTKPTYLQAKWEMEGGYLNNANQYPLYKRGLTFASTLKRTWKYHHHALQNIYKVVDTMTIDKQQRVALKNLAWRLTWRHYLQLSGGYKQKRSI